MVLEWGKSKKHIETGFELINGVIIEIRAKKYIFIYRGHFYNSKQVEIFS